MRKPEQSAEPSIEEILASIRKIIADDGSQNLAACRHVVRGEARNVRRSRPSRSGSGSHQAERFYPEPEEPAPALGEDEILELTEDIMVEDRG